jgi:NADPH-dependent glutamate synthase beta subunit-like oxidoreductase
MALGIPEYRLPRDVLNEEIENIKRAGVDIVLDTALGKDFTLDELFDTMQYSAVILAIGAHGSRSLRCPGEDLSGMLHATEFLKDVALGEPSDMKGKRVAVIGGGNSAIDAARVALRLGASDVRVVYRRRREEMPAQELEVSEAEEEGVQFQFLTTPTRVLGDGAVTGLELQSQELGEFDNSGRRRPVPIEGSEYTIDVDVVIQALGQMPDLSCLNGDSSEVTRGSTFKVSRQLATSRPGVFAAGDAVLGPSTVIEAVAQGNKVALAVDEYLRDGHPVSKEDWLSYRTVELTYNMEDYGEASRPDMPTQPPGKRISNFREVELGFEETVAHEEAKRCLRCDIEEF